MLWLGRQKFRAAILAVHSHANHGNLEVLVFESEPEILSLVVAGEKEQVGRVAIKRFALDFPRHNPLRLSEPGAETVTGLLRAPPPFSGEAEYVKNPGAKPTWTGSLEVALPGTKPLPLAGPSSQADLCISETPQQLDRCKKIID